MDRKQDTSLEDDDMHVYALSTQDDVEDWISQEKRFWREILKQMDSEEVRDQFFVGLEICFDALRASHPASADPDDASGAELGWESLAKNHLLGFIPSRQSSLAKRLLDYRNRNRAPQMTTPVRRAVKDLELASIAYGQAIRGSDEVLFQRQEKQLKAQMLELETLSSTTARISADLLNFSESAEGKRKDFEIAFQKASTVHAAVRDLLEKMPDWKTDLEISATEATRAAVATATEQAKIEAPAKYWRTRKNIQTAISFFSGLVFLGACSAGIYLGPDYFLSLITGKEAKIDPQSPGAYIAYIGAPVFLAIWVLRTVIRIFNNALALREDAAERVTMMQAFLSLMSEGKADEKDRPFMLRAIFRPTKASTAEEPLPSALDAIVNRVSRPSSGVN